MSGWGEEYDVSIARTPRAGRRISKPVYQTAMGAMYCGHAERVLRSKPLQGNLGEAQLILTSPPFPLKTKKRYGNLEGEAYVRWFARFAPLFRDYLTPDGSIVIEIGNAREAGRPVMSTVVLRALLQFLEKGGLNLCQEFIWYNNARLPAPAQWVNVERIRVKDAFTRIGWMSPTERPKADNRKVLREHSKDMKLLLVTWKYNAGIRPSEYHIREQTFNKDNGGAIMPNVIDGDDVPALGSILKPTPAPVTNTNCFAAHVTCGSIQNVCPGSSSNFSSASSPTRGISSLIPSPEATLQERWPRPMEGGGCSPDFSRAEIEVRRIASRVERMQSGRGRAAKEPSGAAGERPAPLPISPGKNRL